MTMAIHPESGAMRCPICRAAQPWSDTCRRCGGDLSLLVQTTRAAGHARREALAALSAGDSTTALAHAEQAHELEPGEATRRLLLACRLATAFTEALAAPSSHTAPPQ